MSKIHRQKSAAQTGISEVSMIEIRHLKNVQMFINHTCMVLFMKSNVFSFVGQITVTLMGKFFMPNNSLKDSVISVTACLVAPSPYKKVLFRTTNHNTAYTKTIPSEGFSGEFKTFRFITDSHQVRRWIGDTMTKITTPHTDVISIDFNVLFTQLKASKMFSSEHTSTLTLSSLLAKPTTIIPFLTSCRQVSSPIPEEAPVTTTTFPFHFSIFLKKLHRCLSTSKLQLRLHYEQPGDFNDHLYSQLADTR
ncbi:hypothetical protein AGLY_004286, partial [Aphis glycines]